MTPEQKFWQLLKPHVPGHVVRIENSLGSGIPDVNYCYMGRECWIELKAGSKLRTSQRIWRETRVRNGGKVFLIERIGSVIVLTEFVNLVGNTVYGIETVVPKPFDWSRIENLLKGNHMDAFQGEL